MKLAETLNLGCACQTLETLRLREQLETDPALAGLTDRLAESHPHLFSPTAVFLDAGVMDQITDAVAVLERVTCPCPPGRSRRWTARRRSPASIMGRPVSSWATTFTCRRTVRA